MELKGRIRKARKDADMTQEALGVAVGVSAPSVVQWESGRSKPRVRRIFAIAEALDVDPVWLGTGKNSNNFVKPASVKGFGSGPKTLPIMGRGEGGPNGVIVLTDSAIDWTFCPPDLQDVEGAFASYVVGDSMVPKYKAGDLVWVHPSRPVRQGRNVLVETTEHMGLIKEFVSHSDKSLVLKQFNPPKTIKVPAKDVRRVMLIIGSLDA